MKGKTNSACNGGDSSGGDIILAENALDKDSVGSGEKVLVRRFSAKPETTQYLKKTKDLICLPILKNRLTIIETPSSSQELVTIENDSTFKKITDLTYQALPWSNYEEWAFLFDDWFVYGNTLRSTYAVNINTQDNYDFGIRAYSGNETYFFTTSESKSAIIYKFNTQNGNLENYFTVIETFGYQYRYMPLLFYKDTFLAFYSFQSLDTLLLYKLNHETQQAEEICSLKNATSIFSPDAQSICPLSPNCCCINKKGGGYHVIKIDESAQTFYYAPLNCLGFEDDISPAHYNTTNKTFTIIKPEDSHIFLNILKFNPEKWRELEFFERIDLTDSLENFRQSIGAENLSVSRYKYVSDDLNRLNLVVYNGSSYYALIMNLKNNLTSWQAVPDFTYNYNKCTLTAITTGKTDEHEKIEVKTTLPDKISISLNANDTNATITVEGAKS